ncbi:MAG: tRNA (guanosine(46)-N7)-methyltransferase TrmB [Pseudomonadota bacterium]
MDKHPPLRTFGRTGGRALSSRQQRMIDEQLPGLSIPIPDDGFLFPETLFAPEVEGIWLEVGFGGGEHLTGQALRHPKTGFIGCEPFIEGMAKCLGQIEDTDLQNVRLLMDDVRPLITSLAPESVDRILILFPDPWPKKRQQKRRLVQTDFLDQLGRIIKPGGQVRFATDVMSYANEALLRFIRHPSFRWLAAHPDDWRMPPDDHITTRYQQKLLGDCQPVWFEFERAENQSASCG